MFVRCFFQSFDTSFVRRLGDSLISLILSFHSNCAAHFINCLCKGASYQQILRHRLHVLVYLKKKKSQYYCTEALSHHRLMIDCDSFIKFLCHLPSTIFPKYMLSVEVSLSVPHDSSEAFRPYVSHREVKPVKNIQ